MPGWARTRTGLNLEPCTFKRLNHPILCSGRLASTGGGAGGAERHDETPEPHHQQVSVDFEQTREAYRSKDSLELLRSLVVFKLCSYDILVDKNKEIMDLGKKVLGQRGFEQFMKMTFYGQFVAGEDHHAIKPLLKRNQAFGVGSVLDYSVEEDIGPEEDQLQEKTDAAFGEGRGGGSYFYADEAKCDQHLQTFLKCIRASGGGSMEGFSAIKITALGRPKFLLRLSEVLLKWRRFFTFLADQQGEGDKETLEKKLELKVLQKEALVPLLEDFSPEDEGQMKRILQRMDALAKILHVMFNAFAGRLQKTVRLPQPTSKRIKARLLE
ncbi:hypothetical protein NHX12_029484 [Muraenolepis orangiensis]|uniref:Proline dehydrogenase n=1 Tax=Muraenolepis orangiensis TaxID=630683 RepID=A0A9Q0EG46_9TELE|nr:hypothetical protein NHX12_029484 [Muraenolepis orangiensis]